MNNQTIKRIYWINVIANFTAFLLVTTVFFYIQMSFLRHLLKIFHDQQIVAFRNIFFIISTICYFIFVIYLKIFYSKYEKILSDLIKNYIGFYPMWVAPFLICGLMLSYIILY